MNAFVLFCLIFCLLVKVCKGVFCWWDVQTIPSVSVPLCCSWPVLLTKMIVIIAFSRQLFCLALEKQALFFELWRSSQSCQLASAFGQWLSYGIMMAWLPRGCHCSLMSLASLWNAMVPSNLCLVLVLLTIVPVLIACFNDCVLRFQGECESNSCILNLEEDIFGQTGW